MKKYIEYILVGGIVMIFIAVWIKISWLIALIVAFSLSFMLTAIMISASSRPNPLRTVTGMDLFFGLLLSITAGKSTGFLIFLGTLTTVTGVIALLIWLGKRGHSFSGIPSEFQQWGYSLLGLAPLTALPQTPPSPLLKKPSCRFVQSDEPISIAGYIIENPLIYVTNSKDQENFDASVVYLGRKVSPPRVESPGALGYWARTSDLTAVQMGNYLQWLSDGRQNPDIDLGYVFLFFYGLERRALVDEKDIESIAIEVIRLLSTYHYSRSFRDYATGLLIHLVMRDWLEATTPLIDKLLMYQDKHISTELQAMLLGHLAKENIALPTTWAFMLAQQDERARTSVVTKRTPEEFENLFHLRYKDKYGDTLCPNLSGKQRTHYYRAASPSLASGYGVQNQVLPAEWPSVLSWRRQFNPVVSIYNSCIDELKGYAQKSKTQGAESIAAYEALPPELREQVEHPLQDRWDTIVDRHSPDDGGMILVPVSELADLQGITFRPKLSLGQSKSMASFVDTFSASIEPDVRYTQKPYKWSDYVAILRLPDEPALPQGQSYALVGMLMPLAMEVSLASGAVEPEEASVIIEFFEERFMLERNDRIRTEALMNVLLNSELSLSGIKNSISSCFSEAQREAIGRFLVIIAGASDGVCHEEVQSLKRTFKALNINTNLVQKFIIELGFGAPEEPVTVQTAEQHEAGEPIPDQTSALDESKIMSIINDTNQIVNTLVEAIDPNNSIPIFQDMDQIADDDSANSDGIPHLSTLREKLHPVLQELLTRSSWQMEEIEVITRQHGMTVAATIDEINEWACENMDDMLLEGEDTVSINYGILQGEK